MKTIFISYNHKDSKIAKKIDRKLRDHKLHVIIDQRDMQHGENINTFIENSICKADVTLSIVSKNSLASAWVAMETVKTRQREKVLLPCYVEPDFLERGYSSTLKKHIKQELAAIDSLIDEARQSGYNYREHESERQRYLALFKEIDDILKFLKESLCMDISHNSFDDSMEKILERCDADLALSDSTAEADIRYRAYFCNRRDQITQFMHHFEKQYQQNENKPQIYVIHGQKEQGHELLVHCMWYTLKQKKYTIKPTDTITWPAPSDKYQSGQDELETTLSSHLSEHNRISEKQIIFLRHPICKWNKKNQRLLEWYIQDMWSGEYMHQYVLFFELHYASTFSQCFDRFSMKRFINKYAHETNRQLSVIDQLRDITTEHLSSWIEYVSKELEPSIKYEYIHNSNLLKELKKNSRYKMEIIYRDLLDLCKRLDHARAGHKVMAGVSN